MRQCSWTWVHKCFQTPYKSEYTGIFAYVFLCAKKKIIKTLRCSAFAQMNRFFCAQGAHHKCYRHSRMDWHTNSPPLPKELDPTECKSIIRNLNGTDRAELKKYFYDASLACFDRLTFQVQIGTNKAIHYNQNEHCIYWFIHLPTKYWWRYY